MSLSVPGMVVLSQFRRVHFLKKNVLYSGHIVAWHGLPPIAKISDHRARDREAVVVNCTNQVKHLMANQVIAAKVPGPPLLPCRLIHTKHFNTFVPSSLLVSHLISKPWQKGWGLHIFLRPLKGFPNLFSESI